MRERRTLAVGEETTLLPFLREQVRDKSRNTVKGLLSRGQVLVDGRVTTRFDAPLTPGQTVTLLPEQAAEEAGLPFPILYEDGELLAVDKPAGLLSVGNEKERRRTGVLLFAKNEKIKRALQDNWDRLVLRRAYLAAVEGRPPRDEGSVRSFLHETATHLVYSGGRGGKEAVTHYRVLAQAGSFSLVEADLDTGRKNQIRVHMQDLGCPVAGDRLYGARTDPMGRLALHACQLRLTDPRSGRILTLRAPLPEGFRKLFPRARVEEE